MPLTNNSIQTIKEYFASHGGLQLSNRFVVNFYNVPSYTTSGIVQGIHAQEVIFPPREISTVADQLQGYGPGRYVPRYQNILAKGVLINFPVTNDSFIMDFFNRWFNYFYASTLTGVSDERNFTLPYYDDAVKPVRMEVSILDPNGNTNNNVVFTEVFPVETQPFTLSMKTENSYVIYPVVFGFRDCYYQISTTP